MSTGPNTDNFLRYSGVEKETIPGQARGPQCRPPTGPTGQPASVHTQQQRALLCWQAASKHQAAEVLRLLSSEANGAQASATPP
eukprot:4172559-Amphidinium_carterae.1